MKISFLHLAMQVNQSLQKRLSNAQKLATLATDKVASIVSGEDTTTAHGSNGDGTKGSSR